MRYYYKNTINKRALPLMLQVMRTGYRNSDFTGWDSGRALFSIGYSKQSKKLVFSVKGLFKKDVR